MKDTPGDPALHFWRTRSVARAMGLNLSDELATGRLTADDYSGLVSSCRGCTELKNCAEWLARPEKKSTSGPQNCRIAAQLFVLKRLN